MFGGASVSLDAEERKLVEHLRKQPSWKFTLAYWVATAIMALATFAMVAFFVVVLSDWPSTPRTGGVLVAVSVLSMVSALLYNRTRWAMVAYRLIRRLGAAGSSPKVPSP